MRVVYGEGIWYSVQNADWKWGNEKCWKIVIFDTIHSRC
jgi:hypothetical protein